jgi:hypothetical protein
MMHYAAALVSAWDGTSNWQPGTFPLADPNRLHELKLFIETEASTLRAIKMKLYPSPFMHYRMDDARRNALIPSVVVAARRLFAYADVGMQQQLQQLQLGDAM